MEFTEQIFSLLHETTWQCIIFSLSQKIFAFLFPKKFLFSSRDSNFFFFFITVPGISAIDDRTIVGGDASTGNNENIVKLSEISRHYSLVVDPAAVRRESRRLDRREKGD